MNNQKTALDSVQKKNALKKDAEIFSLGINIQNSLLRLTTIGILLAIPFIASADNFSMLDMNNEITSTLQAGTPHPIDTAPNNEDYNGSIVIHERAMSKLLNNQYTRKAITEWTDEDAIKQYAKILEKYGDQIKPNKLHKVLSSPQIENLMKNLDELDNLNIENFDDWRIIVVQSNNPATILEADFAILLKNKGHTLKKIGKTEPISKVIGRKKTVQIDVFTEKTGKKIIAEIKAGNPANFIYKDDFLNQLERYAKYAQDNTNLVDEVWLLTKETVPANKVTEFYNDYGVIVKRIGDI